MNRHLRCIGLVTSALCICAAGCSLFRRDTTTPPATETQRAGAARPLTDTERTRLDSLGGQELVTDASKADEPLFEYCINEYANDLEREQAGAPASERIGSLMTCDKACVADGELAAVASKYKALCEQRLAGAKSGLDLQLAHSAVETLRNAETPLARAQFAEGTQNVLDDARAKVGDDNAELAALTEEYDKLVETHAEDIAKGKAFLERSDIQRLVSDIGALQQNLDKLRKSYAELEIDSTRELIERRTTDLRDLEARFEAEGKKAGVL